jgi:hypothetical protein
MSFGFFIGDIIAVTQLVNRVYQAWKSACGNHADVTSDLEILQHLMTRVQKEAQTPDSLFSRNPDHVRGWETLSRGCYTTVTELERILANCRSLSTSRRRNWERIRTGNQHMDSLTGQLAKRKASIAAFLSVLGISFQGRVEKPQGKVEEPQGRIGDEIFPELLKRVDDLAAQVRKGNGIIKSSSTWTTYANDSKSLWREFRRDLVMTAGFRNRDVHMYKIAIQTYLVRLQRDGLLDEEVGEKVGPWSVNINSFHNLLYQQKLKERKA